MYRIKGKGIFYLIIFATFMLLVILVFIFTPIYSFLKWFPLDYNTKWLLLMLGIFVFWTIILVNKIIKRNRR